MYQAGRQRAKQAEKAKGSEEGGHCHRNHERRGKLLQILAGGIEAPSKEGNIQRGYPPRRGGHIQTANRNRGYHSTPKLPKKGEAFDRGILG